LSRHHIDVSKNSYKELAGLVVTRLFLPGSIFGRKFDLTAQKSPEEKKLWADLAYGFKTQGLEGVAPHLTLFHLSSTHGSSKLARLEAFGLPAVNAGAETRR
jgi:hypothetical protein